MKSNMSSNGLSLSSNIPTSISSKVLQGKRRQNQNSVRMSRMFAFRVWLGNGDGALNNLWVVPSVDELSWEKIVRAQGVLSKSNKAWKEFQVLPSNQNIFENLWFRVFTIEHWVNIAMPATDILTWAPRFPTATAWWSLWRWAEWNSRSHRRPLASIVAGCDTQRLGEQTG